MATTQPVCQEPSCERRGGSAQREAQRVGTAVPGSPNAAGAASARSHAPRCHPLRHSRRSERPRGTRSGGRRAADGRRSDRCAVHWEGAPRASRRSRWSIRSLWRCRRICAAARAASGRSARDRHAKRKRVSPVTWNRVSPQRCRAGASGRAPLREGAGADGDAGHHQRSGAVSSAAAVQLGRHGRAYPRRRARPAAGGGTVVRPGVARGILQQRRRFRSCALGRKCTHLHLPLRLHAAGPARRVPARPRQRRLAACAQHGRLV